MPDRETVFDAIRNCITEPKCRDCPWDECEKFDCKKVSVPVSLLLDVLKLLKEHRPGETFTVVDTKTGKEADEYEIALHEDWAKHLCYCDMEGWAIENDGTLLLVDECGQFAYADRERFKVVWDA
jgi:hypothetical protein